MENEGIKSCPNCKGDNIELKRNFDRVQCESCGVTGPWFDGHSEDAISGWNNLPRLERKISKYVMEIKENTNCDYDEAICIAIDNKLVNGILKNWDKLMNSPEYPLYTIMERIKREENM